MLESIKTWFRIKYIKTMHWEYWPMWLVYIPVSFYVLYLSIKARSFFFFSASNPNIENGGMFFESKWLIFQQIPSELFPSTILVNPNNPIEEIQTKMKAANISYPIIAKPDRGERGWLVKKIQNETELIAYRKNLNLSFLIQSYVDLPIELSVFYYRNPRTDKGTITSLTFKKLLTITGNGKNTIQELIFQNDRAFLQYKHLKKHTTLDFGSVLEKDKELEIVPYGNHALGALFINYNHLIDQDLINTFDAISKRIDGFYFGRFDLRCKSMEELKRGKNISILELNGAGAEPAHIYDPSFSFWRAQLVLAEHYKMMFDAAIENHLKGIEFMNFKTFREIRNAEKLYKRNEICA